MTTRGVQRGWAGDLAGTATLVLGVVFALAIGFTYWLSLDATFNPPDWVRFVGLIWLPIGFALLPVGYLVARSGRRRGQARAGMLLALLGLAALVILLFVLG